MIKMGDDWQTRRALALLLFSTPANLINRQFSFLEDFAVARAALSDEFVQIQRLITEDVGAGLSADAVRDRLSSAGSVHDLLSAICGNSLLSSEAPTIEQLATAWKVFRGFDIDGLVLLGDARGDATARWPARYHLRPKFELLLNGLVPAVGPDEHLHYGQMIDLNLMWMLQIRSVHPAPIYSLEAADKKFVQPRNTAQREHWDEIFQCCRRIARFAARSQSGDRREDAANIIASVKELIGENSTTIRDEFKQEAEKGGACFELVDGFSIDRWLYDRAKRHDPGPERELAMIYVLLKNAFFDKVGQNKVRTFEEFSLRLKGLDLMYIAMDQILKEVPTVNYASSLFGAGGTGTGSVRWRMELGSVDRRLARGSAPERVKGNLKLLNRSVALALKRDDIEILEGETRRQALSKLIQIGRSFVDGGVPLVGLDLIGPEVRQVSASAYDRPGGTSSRHARLPIDFIFEARDALTEMLAPETPLYASFHCGEHCGDARLSLLVLAYIVTHPRFAHDRDRVSHALILHERWRPPPASVSDAVIDAIRSLPHAIRENFEQRSREDRLFPDSATLRERLQVCANEMAVDQLAPTPFEELREILLAAVMEGSVKLEVCPASNAMIRRELVDDVTRHPWSKLVGRPNLLVGTDDPSLTQTLPWMEHLFLAASVSPPAEESRGPRGRA